LTANYDYDKFTPGNISCVIASVERWFTPWTRKDM